MISVIIPTFNSGNLILQTLRSIQSQIFKDFEIIIINDGSTDNTLDILTAFKSESKNTDNIIIYSQSNKGPSAARNEGIERANGKYIQFFDADDLMHPYKLQVSFDLITHFNADAVVSDYKRFSSSQHLDMSTRDYDIDNAKTGMDAIKYVLEYGIGSPMVLYKTEVLRAIGGFNEHLVNNEDFELNFRLVCHDVKFIYMPIKLMYYRQHNSPYRLTQSTLRFEHSIIATYLILDQLKNLRNEELVTFAKKIQANKLGYNSVNLLRRGSIKAGTKHLTYAKSLHAKIIVSNNKWYNALNDLIGVGRIDYLVGKLKQISGK